MFAPMEVFIPFATEIDVLIEEKLPGPIFTNIAKFLSTIMLFFLIKSNILITNLLLLF